MKGLKNLVIFVAGGMTFIYLLGKECVRDAKHPREGSIVFENDAIRVIRCTSEPAKNGVNLAIVVNKKKEEEAC